MTGLEGLHALARYNRFMNERLYALAATLSDEARKRDVGAFFKSIHGTFNHLLLADRVWLARFRGVVAPDGFMAPGIRTLDQELYSDFDELRRERELTDDELSSWIVELTPDRLAAPLVYRRQGQQLNFPLWWAVRTCSTIRRTIADKSRRCSVRWASIPGSPICSRCCVTNPAQPGERQGSLPASGFEDDRVGRASRPSTRRGSQSTQI